MTDEDLCPVHDGFQGPSRPPLSRCTCAIAVRTIAVDALREALESVHTLHGYRVQGQGSFLAHLEKIERGLATALRDITP